jgi:cytochrome c5
MMLHRATDCARRHPGVTMTIHAVARVACLALLAPLSAGATPQAAEGRKLVQQHKCEACHESKVYGPPGSVYTRKDRKVTSWEKLKAQVAGCNTMLNIGLFPDDEEHVAAYLNEAYYKLPMK